LPIPGNNKDFPSGQETSARHGILFWTKIKKNLKFQACTEQRNRLFISKENAMPIYEYRCQECKGAFEIIVTAAETAVETVCPKCGSGAVKKTISASSFRISSGSGAIPAGALSGCSTKSGFS
jgi:putative FmdB family regulatory protein